MSDRKDVRVHKEDHIWLTGDIAVVEVGEKKELVYTYKDLLVKRSRHFAALAGKPRAGGLRGYSLPSEDPETFKFYVQYISSGKIPCKGHFSQMQGIEMSQEELELSILLDLCLLAQNIKDITAMDAFISAVLARSCEATEDGFDGVLPGDHDISKVYEKTPARSPLRRLIVDLFVSESDVNFVHRWRAGAVTSEFLLDYSEALTKRHQELKEEHDVEDDIDETSSCNYHQHKEYEPCQYRKRKRADSDNSSESEEADSDDDSFTATIRKAARQEMKILGEMSSVTPRT